MTETIDVTPKANPSGPEPGKFGFIKPGPNKRVCAFLIDLILIQTGLVLLGSKAALSVGAFGSVLFLLMRDIFNGAGPGKRLVGLQVLSDEGYIQSAKEALLRNLPLLIGPLQLVEYFVMLFSPEGKRLGDKIARTRVADTKPHLSDGMFLWISILLLIGFTVTMNVTGHMPVRGQCPLAR